MDQLHLEATGEHLSPIPGDMCPRPVEYYIAKTKEKQARRDLYKHYYEKMRASGNTTFNLLMSYEDKTHWIPYHSSVQLQQDVIGCPIYLFGHGGAKTGELWPDGRERQPPTPACSAPSSPALILKLPPWAMRSRVSSPAPLSPIVGLAMEESATAPVSRLRGGFQSMLKKMPLDALYAELTEWTEEQARAAEHVAAIEAEIATRG
jgi:hypothetical protein